MNINIKFAPKQKIVIKELETPGLIIKIEIQPDVVLYNVQYWLNGEQKFAWLMEDEIE